MSDEVLLTHDGFISILSVNRPDKLNALNRAVLEGVTAAIAECSARETRCLIVTGVGKAFVAGADIGAMQTMSPAEAEQFSKLGHLVGNAMEDARFPIIAAVNGFALGGGCELLLACDFAYASSAASFGQPEVNLGVIPGFGGTQRLMRRVGIAMAKELVFSGKRIDANEALRIGLINAVVSPEELMDKTLQMAKLIAGKGPVAIHEAKKVFHAGADVALRAANNLEAEAFGRCFASSDQREGMTAFVERREPKFTGK